MPTVAVVGASGGLGASTFTCTLAHAARRRGLSVVLVDGDTHSGGLDVTSCCEHLPGYRWSDLGDVRGRVDVRRLTERLPGAGGVPVLSGGPVPGGARRLPDGPAVRDVLVSLERAVDLVAVDLPGWPPPEGFTTVDVVVLVVGLTARGVADAEMRAAQLNSADVHPGLITRGRRRGTELAEQLAAHLGLPWWAHLPDEKAVPRDEHRGRCPGTRRRGRMASGARRVLHQLGDPPEPRPWIPEAPRSPGPSPGAGAGVDEGVPDGHGVAGAAAASMGSG